MTTSDPDPRRGSVVVGLFETEPKARAAAEAVQAMGFERGAFDVLPPADRPSPSQNTVRTEFLTQAASSAEPSDVESVLASLGVPEGEARFYAEESREGRTLLVVRANGRADEVRRLVQERGGSDVQSRGRDLIRGQTRAVRGGTGARPVDITDDWVDVRSRYQMLWQQHYGTTDATWEQTEPLYRRAFQLANDPRYRARPWSEVESALKRDWTSAEYGSSAD